MQLKERRFLQQKIRQLNFHHEINVKILWKETGVALRQIDNDLGISHLPSIDPKQPLILPEEEGALSLATKVRLSPETILDVISDKKEFFTRNDILRGLANYIEEPTTLRLAIDQVFRSKELVELLNDTSPRYTTRGLQNLKAKLADKTQSMVKVQKFRVNSHAINSAIARQNRALQQSVGANLSKEQEVAIQHILSPEQLSIVVGFAGAGKSTMLTAAREAWEQQGYHVIGAALSGKAADGLESSSGIQSRTLASLEYSWKHGYQPLQAGDVLVIDEAGMVATKQLARIVEHVQKCKAKLVLVGDPEQLQPIQAGTPFKDIAEQVSTARLTEIRRQKQAWQCDASRYLAKQQTSKALEIYENKGFVKCTEDRLDAITALVEGYMSDVELHGTKSSRLALAHRRKDVHLINQTIRAAHKSAGRLIDEQLFKTNHGPRALACGDRILFTRNDKELGLRNGMLGSVEKMSQNQITVRIDSDDGGEPCRITIDPNSYGALDHGYATTIHKSQGATVDRAFVLGSTTMDRHITYVAMTRHREDVHLYMDKIAEQKIYRLDIPKAEKTMSIIHINTRQLKQT